MSNPESESKSPSSSGTIESLVEQFLNLSQRVNAPSITEFARSHPRVESQLLEVLETLRAVDTIKPQGAQLVEPQEEQNAALERIGDYRLLREAGRGGMGVVYEAIQVSLDRKVALKVLPQSLFQDERARQRFQLEARAAAQLHHSNIVPVHEVGLHEGNCFYAMQFIQGETLDCVIKRLREIESGQVETRGDETKPSSEKPSTHELPSIAMSLSGTDWSDATAAWSSEDNNGAQFTSVTTPHPSAVSPTKKSDSQGNGSSFGSSSGTRPFYRNVARLGRQAALGLEYSHSHNILHRDIKPANLMLDTAGQLWITDFGLAKLEDSDDLTRDGDIVGTLRYMAPERFEGICDERSDVFSLGVTLYEFLALQPPFAATDRLQLINLIKQSTPRSLRSIDHRIPYDLQTIVEKAMERESSRRYASAQELADDLLRFCEGRPIHARRVSAVEKLWLWSRKNTGLAAALALVAVLLTGGTIASAVAAIKFHASREEARLQSEEATKQRNLAEQQSKLAYDTLNRVLFDIQDSLAEIPAASRSRQRLLMTAIEGLEKTSEQHMGSANVDRRIAAALQELSKLSRITSNSVQQDIPPLEFAEQCASRAVAISERILIAKPNHPLALRDLSVSLSRLAEVQRDKGQLELALETITRALAYAKQTLTSRQYRVKGLRDMGDTLNYLTQIQTALGDHEGVVDSCAQSLVYTRQLRESVPDDPEGERNEAIALLTLGDAQRKVDGNSDEAVENLEHGLAMLQTRVDETPDNVKAQRDLSIALEMTGLAYAQFGMQEERLDVVGRAAELAQQMLDEDPNNLDMMLGVVDTQGTLGDALGFNGKFTLAVESCLRSQQLADKLLAAAPQNALYRKRAYTSAVRVAQAQKQQGELPQSLAAFERAKEVAELDVDDSPRGEQFKAMAQTMKDAAAEVQQLIKDENDVL